MAGVDLSGTGWLLDVALMIMLAATMFHALRLERALGILRRDRAALEELIAGFNESTRQAETGIERLRTAADGAGRQIARHVDQARSLKSDLEFLTTRGERLADQLDGLVRQAKPADVSPSIPALRAGAPLSSPGKGEHSADIAGDVKLRSQAEKDLVRALRMAR